MSKKFNLTPLTPPKPIAKSADTPSAVVPQKLEDSKGKTSKIFGVTTDISDTIPGGSSNALNASLPGQPDTLTPNMPVSLESAPSAVQSDPKTNLGQTQDKPKTIHGQNPEQPKTNLGQTSDKKAQTKDKLRTQPGTNLGQNSSLKQIELRTNSGQTSDNTRIEPRTTPRGSLLRLGGLKLNLMQALYDLCRVSGSRETGPVTPIALAQRTASTAQSIQKTLQRMEAESYLKRADFKAGRGGWTSYEIPMDIWGQITSNDQWSKPRTNLGQADFAPESEPRTEPRTNGSSKLVSNLNSEIPNLLAQDLREVSFAAVEPYNVTPSVLADFQKNRWHITRTELEQHIERFATWASDSKNTKGVNNLRAIFCSNIATIAKEGMDPLDYVKTAQDAILEDMLKRRTAARLERQKIETQLRDVEFQDWEESLSQNEKNKLIPPTEFLTEGSERHRLALKAHFEDHVWPELKFKLTEREVQGT
jgi:hypothetical protein